MSIKTECINRILKFDFENEFVIDSISGSVYSYNTFFALALSFGNYIRKRYSRVDKLVLVLENSVELCALYFTCILYDFIAVPIDPRKGSAEICELIMENQDGIIVSEKPLEPMPEDCKKIIITEMIVQQENIKTLCTISIKNQIIDILSNYNFEKPYLITYTSGTSGHSKGVIHSVSNLFASALAFGRRFNFNISNRFFHAMPMTYMAGILNTIFLPFIFGSSIILSERFQVKVAVSFWRVVERYKINTFWFSPAMLMMLLKLDRGNMGVNYLKDTPAIFCVGTAPLTENVKCEFEGKYNVELFQSYGLSETLFISTNDMICKCMPDCVGRLLEGVTTQLTEDKEILLSVPWMFLGYTNELSDEYIVGDFYRTGDLGEIDNLDVLKITGRKKDLIIKGGMNISPKRIEDFISSKAYLDNFLVFPRRDECGNEFIACGFTDMIPDLEVLKNEVNREIATELGETHKIDEFIKLRRIPLNLNGKIDKRYLTENLEEFR